MVERASGDYRVAVAVANPDHVEQLMRTALDLARDRGGDVFVTSVVVQSRSSPFRLFRDEDIKEEFGGDRRELLDRALAVAGGTDVPVEGRLVVAGNVAGGVVRVAAECEADAVLLGWHARRHRDLVMGHIIDDVVTSAPCDVLVEKLGPTADGVESVLVPAGAGPDTAVATTVGGAVARANDARVDVLRVVDPDAPREERERAASLAADVAADLGDVTAEPAVLEGADVVATLVEAAEARDVTVVGGGRGGWLRRLVVGSTAREVGRRARTTVIVATRPPEVRSRVARLIT